MTQTLAYGDHQLYQLAYLPETERPVAICILVGDNDVGVALKSGMHADMQYAYWLTKTHAVVVVGDMPSQQMVGVVEEVWMSLHGVLGESS